MKHLLGGLTFLMIFAWMSDRALAQNNRKIDSLFALYEVSEQDTLKIQLLSEISQELFSNDPVKAQYYTNRIMQLSEYLGYRKGMALSHKNTGTINYYQGNFKEALESYSKSLEIQEEEGDQKGMASSYNNIGAIHASQGNYVKALENYFSSLEILESLNEQSMMAATYNNIGAVHQYQGNYDKAREYYSRALEIKEDLGDVESVATIMNNLGVIFFEEGRLTEALEHYFESLKTRVRIGDQRGMAVSYTNMGEIYAARGEYEQALVNHQQALKIQEEIGDKKGMTYALNGMAEIYTRLNKPRQAIEILQNSIDIAKEIGARAELKDAYKGLATAYVGLNDYRNAYYYKQKQNILKDTLYSEETAEKIASMEARYETAQKSVEIELLKKENELTDAQLQRSQAEVEKSRILVIALLVGGLFVVLIALIIASSYREKKKVNTVLSQQFADLRKQKDEKVVLLKEIHHRVKNNLQVINSLISLQSHLVEDKKALALFEECQNRVRAMALIHEKMYESNELSSLSIREYIQVLTNSLVHIYRLRHRIELDIKVSVDHLGLDTLIPLGLLLNEFISNSLKYAFPGRSEGLIFVHLESKGIDDYELMIGDDGIGLPQEVWEEHDTTLGLELIKTLTGQLDGTIERVDCEGTVFTIRFKGLDRYKRKEISEFIAEQEEEAITS